MKAKFVPVLVKDAPQDARPIAYHCVMVECFADGKQRVRLESGRLSYSGEMAQSHDVEAYVPHRGELVSTSQAADDVELAARMIAKALRLETKGPN